MIENAIRGARQFIAEHGQAMGALFARFAVVAAGTSVCRYDFAGVISPPLAPTIRISASTPSS